MRNHPAINYYRSGILIVIAGDDPGSFGYNDLTVDYYLNKIYCVFGLTETEANLNKLNELVCDTPLGFGEDQIVEVSILADDFIINTGLEYKFVASSSIKYEEDNVDDVSLVQNEACSRLGPCTVYLFFIYC